MIDLGSLHGIIRNQHNGAKAAVLEYRQPCVEHNQGKAASSKEYPALNIFLTHRDKVIEI